MRRIRKLFLILGGICTLILAACLVAGQTGLAQMSVVAAAVCLSIGIGAVERLRGYQYTAWIIVAIIAGLLYPDAFLNWGKFDLRNKWVILFIVQGVMFGMGTQMSLKDFSGFATTGKGVLVGLLCQFSIMPVVGFVLTKVFHFQPEIAAGIILIGSCSSGLASNVMVYIAGADLTLSVTLTATATLLAPIMTPMLMKIFADTYIHIQFTDMCIQIIKIVIVPIGAAFIFDALKHQSPRVKRAIVNLSVGAAGWLVLAMFGLWHDLAGVLAPPVLQWVVVFNFICGAFVFGVVYYHINKKFPRLNNVMPYFSMFGIVYFTTVTTAASQEHIMEIGIFILVASVLHNTFGYFLGYWISRLLGLGNNSARTVALEVGLQNGGMASGIAGVMGKLATLGLAAAIFSPWMNISGSVLANYWKKRKE